MQLLLEIIGLLYDTILDPGSWPAVLERVGGFVEAARVALVDEDALDPGASIFYQSFNDPEWIARYIESFLLINPMRLATVASVAAGDVVLTGDFMSPQEYARTRFAREWLGARGLVDISAAVLEKSSRQITVLSALHDAGQGFAGETTRRKLAALAPHARRAIAIGRVFERRTIETGALADTLDKLAAAVFLVDDRGQVLHASESGRDMLDKMTIANRLGHRLRLTDADADAALHKALVQARAGDATIGAEGIAIALRDHDERPHVAMVMPLTSGRRADTRHRAVAAVSIQEAAFRLPASVAALSRLHDLTRRELTVLTASVELGSPAEIAAILGLSDNTVKTHLRAIYQKTGASRRADLVKLVAGATGPFRGGGKGDGR